MERMTLAISKGRVGGRVFINDSAPSLMAVLLPGSGLRVMLAAAAGCLILTAALAQARLFLPGNPVPVTLQTLGVLLTGGLLGWRWAFVSMVAYYLVGMAGLPVFQGGQGGWQYVSGSVSGGYVLGFLLAAPVVGYLTQQGLSRYKSLFAMLAGSLIVYLPALLWLTVFDFGWPGEGRLWLDAVVPFFPGDLLKAVLSALAIGTLWTYADMRRKSCAAKTEN